MTPGSAPAPKPKSWFARHKVLTGIGALVLVILLVSLLNPKKDNDATAPATPTTTSTTTEAATEGATEATAPATQATTQETKKEEKKDGVAIGEAGKDGDAELTVDEWTCGLDSIGSQYTEISPQGQFCQAKVTVKNVGNKALTWWANEQKLKNAAGAEYKTTDEMWRVEGAEVMKEINPGNALTTLVIFDVPVDAAPTVLELHGGMFTKGLKVNVA